MRPSGAPPPSYFKVNFDAFVGSIGMGLGVVSHISDGEDLMILEKIRSFIGYVEIVEVMTLYKAIFKVLEVGIHPLWSWNWLTHFLTSFEWIFKVIVTRFSIWWTPCMFYNRTTLRCNLAKTSTLLSIVAICCTWACYTCPPTLDDNDLTWTPYCFP